MRELDGPARPGPDRDLSHDRGSGSCLRRSLFMAAGHEPRLGLPAAGGQLGLDRRLLDLRHGPRRRRRRALAPARRALADRAAAPGRDPRRRLVAAARRLCRAARRDLARGRPLRRPAEALGAGLPAANLLGSIQPQALVTALLCLAICLAARRPDAGPRPAGPGRASRSWPSPSSARRSPTGSSPASRPGPAGTGRDLRRRPVGLVAPPQLFLRMAGLARLSGHRASILPGRSPG